MSENNNSAAAAVSKTINIDLCKLVVDLHIKKDNYLRVFQSIENGNFLETMVKTVKTQYIKTLCRETGTQEYKEQFKLVNCQPTIFTMPHDLNIDLHIGDLGSFVKQINEIGSKITAAASKEAEKIAKKKNAKVSEKTKAALITGILEHENSENLRTYGQKLARGKRMSVISL